MIDLIVKKRNGQELTRAEYEHILNGFVSGEIPDYQVSAFLMAVCFRGMSNKETAVFTDVMMRSGDLIDLSGIDGIKVDKHSTGGVGDKTTLVLAPLVAAAGVPVAKMSGRAMGHTGGTLDKMESIPGMRVDMSQQEFIDAVRSHGIAICGQSENLVPADKMLYALRDVTGTVKDLSLISSSIMSKKLACGADAIVIDIKVGVGAYVETLEEAETLAEMMIGIGKEMGRKVIAVVTGMNEPLGCAVGNALEVKEAIATLRGNGPADLTELCLELGAHMLVLGQVEENHAAGRSRLENLISNGAGLEKLKELVAAQHGNANVVDQPDLLPNAEFSLNYECAEAGFLVELNALKIGKASMKLGAGRETVESEISYGAGILLMKKIGDLVKKGETIAILYTDNKSTFRAATDLIDSAVKIAENAPEKMPLIHKTIQ